jgi:hypothetical protein
VAAGPGPSWFEAPLRGAPHHDGREGEDQPPERAMNAAGIFSIAPAAGLRQIALDWRPRNDLCPWEDCMISNFRLSVHVSAALIAAGLLGALGAAPAQALTAQECSAKYKAAKENGTLGDQKWNDFRKAQCGSDAAAAPAATPAAAKPEAKEAKPKADKAAKTEAAPAAPAGPAVFPTAVAPKYASEKPGKARLQTCLDQYNANKEKNENGGMKWIQKGGGYYSECTKRLKT